MKKNEDIKKGVLLISTLADALAEIECKTREEIRIDLRKEKIDLDSSMARFKKSLSSLTINSEEQHKNFVTDTGKDFKTECKSVVEKITGWSKDKIIGRINELSLNPGTVYGASYKKLEDKSIEDLSALLKDLEIVLQKGGKSKK